MDFHPLIPIIRYINLGLLFVAIIYWTWICIKCKIEIAMEGYECCKECEAIYQLMEKHSDIPN